MSIIIAEVAQGFEGNFTQSRLLIRAACAAGANCVKFQLIYADELATPDYKYYDLFKGLEFEDEQWIELKNVADKEGIELVFDIFGERSVALAEKLNIRMIKLHATDISNERMLSLLTRSNIPRIILGSGGATLSEISKAIDLLNGKEIIIMLGFQIYPTKDQDNQISRIPYLKSYFSQLNDRIKFGFSDHADPESPSCLTIPATAIGAGATIIEKHITLSKALNMEDHESALNPDEFLHFVKAMKNTFESVGHCLDQDDFGMSEDEKKYRNNIRRHVVMRAALEKGEKILKEDVLLKRTAIENPLYEINSVYGKILKNTKMVNEALTQDDLI